jgi:D-alanyl-D-alanine carboxypeptidase/D-alanyl-D-alanine-endopeptidase (penicillin-binding protein 4)
VVLSVAVVPLSAPLAVAAPGSGGTVGTPTPEEEAAEAALRRCVEARLLTRHRGMWGVLIKDTSTGRVLFDRNAHLPFNPASNVKLVTTAAALGGLGPRFRFATELFGRVDRGRVVGGLYLRGGGDPTLITSDLDRLAAALRQRGVRQIEGPLYLDNSAYDGPTDPPGYRRFRSSHPFRAGVDALSLNYNVVRITITPAASAGELAAVTLEPGSSYFKLQGRVRTSRRRPRLRVATHSKGQWTGVSTTGRLPPGGRPRSFWRRVYQPALYAGHTFLRLLEARGVTFVKHRVLRSRRVPADLPRLALHRSAPLATIVRAGNKRSRNLVAEQLLLALGASTFGAPATYAKGRRAVAGYLGRVGIPPGTYRLENGSGLSRRSRMRPADLVAVLERLHQDLGTGPEIRASLPVAGQDGTLRRRFRGTIFEGAMRAKTGTLSGILSLSGYIGHRGRRLTFSFLTARVHSYPASRRMQRRLSECMMGYLRRVEP